jgi:hypothetical protein
MFGVPLWSVLSACVVAALLLRDGRMIRGSLALLANWCVLTAAYQLTGDQYNVPLNMTVDWATIWIGFAPATQLPQVFMAMLFGTGMIFHADHLLKLWLGVPLEQLKAPYWWRFHYLAWGQAALVIGWECHGGGRTLLRTMGRLGSAKAVHHRDCRALQSESR